MLIKYARLAEKYGNEKFWADDWCSSVAVIIPKMRGPADRSNFRPIAVIPHVCKGMLNIILSKVKKLKGKI